MTRRDERVSGKRFFYHINGRCISVKKKIPLIGFSSLRWLETSLSQARVNCESRTLNALICIQRLKSVVLWTLSKPTIGGTHFVATLSNPFETLGSWDAAFMTTEGIHGCSVMHTFKLGAIPDESVLGGRHCSDILLLDVPYAAPKISKKRLLADGSYFSVEKGLSNRPINEVIF
jgi:hypothetical protein